MKIHCSEQIKEILDEIGGYELEDRGMVAMKGKGELRTFWLTDQNPEYRRETPLDFESDDDESPMHGSAGPKQRTSTNYLFAESQPIHHRDSFSSVGKKEDSKPPSTGGCPCCNDMQAAKRRSNQSLDRKEVQSTHSDGGYKSQNCITDCSTSREALHTPGDRNSISLDTRLVPSAPSLPSSTGNNGKVLMSDLLLDLDIPKKPGDNDVSINLTIDNKEGGETIV